MIRRTLITIFAGLLISPAVFAANDIDNLGALNPSQFKLLSKDLGAALSFKPVTPAEPLGIVGFDIGVVMTGADLENSDVWKLATTSNDAPSTLVIPKIQGHKGLPAGFDIGGFLSSVPASNIKLVGGELRYAILDGSIATPALAVRGTYSKLTGVDELDLDTKGLDLSISKGFALFTPYAGIGRIWTDSESTAPTNLTKESIQQDKYYLGGNFNFSIFNVVVEFDQTGDIKSYNGKLGLRF